MTPQVKKLAVAGAIVGGLYLLQHMVSNAQVKAVCFGAIGSVLIAQLPAVSV